MKITDRYWTVFCVCPDCVPISRAITTEQRKAQYLHCTQNYIQPKRNHKTATSATPLRKAKMDDKASRNKQDAQCVLQRKIAKQKRHATVVVGLPKESTQ
ncbi:hypothetical protein PoB_000013300 [Plakobranchus ocellatus]|uniref:Small EDRK-rich factor-like N-terminal domain-containing protein n=1 Tax=Plakobranchus ocellatus TaxID=259542 RepID=A0AAV3XU59_9GAST|nr:hypothetical protein PoB_000013300 [Plakobranchus ocellatus]